MKKRSTAVPFALAGAGLAAGFAALRWFNGAARSETPGKPDWKGMLGEAARALLPLALGHTQTQDTHASTTRNAAPLEARVVPSTDEAVVQRSVPTPKSAPRQTVKARTSASRGAAPASSASSEDSSPSARAPAAASAKPRAAVKAAKAPSAPKSVRKKTPGKRAESKTPTGGSAKAPKLRSH